MKNEIISVIDGSLKDNIIAIFSKKYYRFLKRQEAKFYLNNQPILPHNEISKNTKILIEFNDYINKKELEFDFPIDIVYENNDFIIINKPPHLNTIPSRREPSNSLYNALYTYLSKNNKLNTIHIITRLDKETSGLVLVALNKEMAIYLNKINSKINKIYYAKIEGHLNEEHFFIEKGILKSNDSIKRIISDKGSYAKTEVTLFKRNIDYDIVSLKLYTGRTHQIRVHLSSINHSVIGDTLYGKSDKRLYLHCALLNFKLPNNEEVTFESLPDWLD